MKNLMTAVVLALLCGAPKQVLAGSLDGTPSTGSFRIVNNANLKAATATGSFTVNDTTMTNVSVSVGKYQLRQGRDWNVGTSSNATAANIAAAINASNAPATAAAVTTNVVSLTAVDSGALYNGVTLSVYDPAGTPDIAVSGANMTGGLDNAWISINGTKLNQGADWYVQDTASGTATSITFAVERSAVAPLILASANLLSTGTVNGYIFLQSRKSAQPYTLGTSSQNDLAASAATLYGGTSGSLAHPGCFLGVYEKASLLPTSGFPAGCIAYALDDATHIQVSTKAVTTAIANDTPWLAK